MENTGDGKFQLKKPLTKPVRNRRGVYGGNLVGQALLVAIRTAPPHFLPHSLHSQFLKKVSDTEIIKYSVDSISNGTTFCNRTVRAFQGGVIKYIAHISLTKKNLLAEAENAYYDYEEKVQKVSDEDEEPEFVPKPFYFETPYPSWLAEESGERLYVDLHLADRYIVYKIPRRMLSLEDTRFEDSVPVTQRRMLFMVRLGKSEKEKDVDLPDAAFQYAGLGVLSDLYFLTRLARILRIENVDLTLPSHYFSVSLDHTMYFHDVGFDCTDWMAFAFKTVRLVNNRVLLEGEMYNRAGQHVATIVQEGLVHFNGLEKQVKL